MRHLLILVVLTLPLATADPLFALIDEQWESGMDGWTVAGTGASIDCDVGVTGCSLELAFPCCGERTTLTRPVGLLLRGPVHVAFDFRGDSTSGDQDAEFIADLGDGRFVMYVFTEQYNNEVRIVTSDGTDVTFGSWPLAERWYGADLVLDPVLGLATATLSDESGAPLAATSVPLPSGVSRLEGFTITGVFWGGIENSHHVDDIEVGVL